MSTCKPVNPNNPLDLIALEVLPKEHPQGGLVLTIDHHHIGPPEAKITIDIRGTKGYHCLGCCCLPQTMGLKATGVCYLPPHRCCPGQIDPRDLGIPDVGDGIEKMEPI